MTKLDEAVLVLNTNYEPMDTITTRRALLLVLRGKAYLEEMNGYINTGSAQWEVPSVVRLLHFRKLITPKRAPTRRAILARDQLTCQYCGHKFPPQVLTLDHIIPKSQGGKSLFGNLVACCRPCNNLKSNRTPEQARMPLLAKPQSAGLNTNRAMLRLQGQARADWRKYLWF
jgi:5-methylcytosine-specific restriction endonuclease McrA